MYDKDLVESFERCQKKRRKVFAFTYIVLLIVFLAPLFLQRNIGRFTYANQAIFYLVWITTCFSILIYGGFGRLMKVARSLSWVCPKCGEKLQFKQIKRMLQSEECPFCHEAFRDGQ